MGLFLMDKRGKELGFVGGGQCCRPSPDTCVATRQTPERFSKTFLPVAYASSLRSKAEPYAVNDFSAAGREPSGVLAKMRKPEGLRPAAKTSSNTGNKSFTA
ncbi:hypothetical protein [Stieleria neptunia]|uniref:hypothetical protein n=1 Tax=Stieleria neptunia TaxID=2527979 RepID=UPI0018D26617|nr:hypothetical protein [Stieleria neptunia]